MTCFPSGVAVVNTGLAMGAWIVNEHHEMTHTPATGH